MQYVLQRYPSDVDEELVSLLELCGSELDAKEPDSHACLQVDLHEHGHVAELTAEGFGSACWLDACSAPAG